MPMLWPFTPRHKIGAVCQNPNQKHYRHLHQAPKSSEHQPRMNIQHQEKIPTYKIEICEFNQIKANMQYTV